MTCFALVGQVNLKEFIAMEFSNVTAKAKANIYFDGKVVSHGIVLEDGTSKTFGLIYPGSYHFGTEKAERMEITDGICLVTLDGVDGTDTFAESEHFDVPANSGFTIEVNEGICQYVCSYIES